MKPLAKPDTSETQGLWQLVFGCIEKVGHYIDQAVDEAVFGIG